MFTDLVALTVVTVAIPYLFSACAQLSWLVSGRRTVHGWLLVRDLAITGASVLLGLASHRRLERRMGQRGSAPRPGCSRPGRCRIVFDQAGNRLHTIKAAVVAMIGA